MLRAIIFILLKIAEAAVVIFVPYFVGKIVTTITNVEVSAATMWLGGLGLIGGFFLLIFVIGIVIALNLDLSEMLAKKYKRKK